MPIFFNVNGLTTGQKGMYGHAVSEYERVQKENQIKALTTGKYAESYKHQPGPKSALFFRLLEAKPALESPPPTKFHYPWYEIVESPGPHQVLSVDGRISAPCYESQFVGGNNRLGFLGINQCLWQIVDANNSAMELWEMCNELEGGREKGLYLKDNWDRLVSIYKSSPEFVVSFGDWGSYRMHVGRESTLARKVEAESFIDDGNHYTPSRATAPYDPLDLWWLNINAEIIDRSWEKFELLIVERMCWMLEKKDPVKQVGATSIKRRSMLVERINNLLTGRHI